LNQIVFNTDVTKVLSADSYLASRFSPNLPTPPPADPKAPTDFFDLVEVVTNKTLLQYRPAENQTGPLNQACKQISVETEAIRKPPPQPIRNLDGVTKDAEQALSFFVPLMQTEESIRQLAEWVRFQVSTSYLQNIFWDEEANTEPELQYALEVYKRECPTDTFLINAAVGILGPHPFGYALERLNHDYWSPADFFLAYTFWAYIKGCRFARDLSEGDIYVVHWLRKSAINESDGAKIGSQETLGVKIPWGPIIKHQLRSLPANTSVEPLADALIRLRKHSITESKHAVTKKKRHEFLRDGLENFNEVMGVKTSSTFDKIIKISEKTAVSGIPFGLGHPAKFLMQKVYRPTKSGAMKTIKYLESTDSRVSDYIKNGEWFSNVLPT